MTSSLNRISLVSSVFSFALASVPTPAHACSAFLCLDPSGFPTTATLPANAGGVFMSPGHSYSLDLADLPSPALRLSPPGSASVDLTVTVADHSIAPFYRVAVRTDAQLPVGATLTLRAASPCDLLGSDGGTAELADVTSWTVTEAVPLPTTLGTLSVEHVASGTVPQPVSNGSCDEPKTTAYADIVLEPSTEAAPWSDVFIYETLVDGGVFLPVVTLSPFNGYSGQSQSFGGSWRGRGIDRVFARCGSMTSGLPEGTYGVAMRARLPDGTVLVTDEVSITLTCPPSEPDAGVDTDAGTETDLGVDLGTDAAAPDAGPTATLHGSGMGCSVTVAQGGATMSPLVVLAALAGWLRRRARSRAAR